MVSENKLPTDFDNYLDAEIANTDFKPKNLATGTELQNLVTSEAYQKNKPTEKV